MFRSLKPFFFLGILCCATVSLTAQHVFNFESGKFTAYQDSLVRLANDVYAAEDQETRFGKNAQMIRTLVNALKQPHSFKFGFDSLKSISILKSPDNSFRIFSWQVPLDGGTYRYFGTIQVATTDGKLKLYPLIDDTDNLKDDNQVTGHKNWYGARYYEIVPVMHPLRGRYFVLLGWKGYSSRTSRKVIEILSLENDEVVFGRKVFEGSKALEERNRIVFEYSKLNSMTLVRDKSTGMIVYDHLAPISPDMAGNFEFYASDLSFDGFKLAGGKLKLVENIELKNDPNDMDELYIDPNDKDIPALKKF